MTSSVRLRVVGIGAGYFAPFQYEAWKRMPEAEVTAVCSRTRESAQEIAGKFGIPNVFTDWRQALDIERPDVVDIITPPDTHEDICAYAAERGIHIICQKPLAPDIESSRRLVAQMNMAQVRFMVHENWRWQPWYRQIKRIAEQGDLGSMTHIHVLTRLGDGWGPEPYKRQAFFRQYPRLLLHETGIHFVDTFRFLLGDVQSVFASLQRSNPVIRGEDSGLLQLKFASGATAVWDANRVTESDAPDPRLTFGEIRVDFSGGHLTVDSTSRLEMKKFGEPKVHVPFEFRRDTFAGDCVYAVQRHFVDCLASGSEFEGNASDYLRSIEVVEAAYESNETKSVVQMAQR